MTDTFFVTPGRPYSARIYYYACREDVEAMLAKGYNIRNVYDHMKEQGRFSCGYSAFCDYVRGGGKRLHSKRGKSPKSATAAPVKNTGPIIIGRPKEPFPDPRTMDIKDCI